MTRDLSENREGKAAPGRDQPERRWRAVRLDADHLPLQDIEAERYAEAGVQVIESSARQPQELIAALGDMDAVLVVGTRLSAEVIATLDRCRAIVRIGSGTDNIAVDEATRKGIAVTNVPGFCTQEVAEQTWALILALARGILATDRATRQGAIRVPPPWIRGLRRTAGQTLGIVGFGRVGRKVAWIARGFDMKVLACDPMVSGQSVAEAAATLVDLDRLLAESDIVSVNCPLTSSTHHLIAGPQLRRMKPTAVLINTSRGAVIDQNALVRALREDWIAGAGLDVYDPEPPGAGDPLFDLDNVVVTPHSAAISEESRQEVFGGSAEQAIKVLSGRCPDFLVNGEVKPWFVDGRRGWPIAKEPTQ